LLESLRQNEGVTLISVPMSRQLNPVKDFIALARIVAALRRIRPEVVNASTPKAGLLTLLAAKIVGTPLRIYTLRGLRLEGEKTGSLTYRILRSSERLASACAHWVVCVSPSLRDRAVEIGAVPPGKAIVLGSGSSNGIDLRRFRRRNPGDAELTRLRKLFGISGSQPVVGFVGRLAADKGIDTLISAFVAARDDDGVKAQLLLIGDIETEDPPSAETLRIIAERADIISAGQVTDPAAFYSLMDLLAFPSRREGLPNAVLEAAASGVPAITTDATGAVDSVVDGVTGVVVPVGNPSRLQSALVELINDSDRRRELGAAAVERVRAEFDSQLVWARLNELYGTITRRIPVRSSYGGTE
jgi:glycosyltransferase involved in cell wall biosynthesis